mgnify:CR=1 FL=1
MRKNKIQKSLTKQEHITRHKELHGFLDELIADFITHTKKHLAETTLMDLMKWSHQQTINPSETDNKENAS